MTKLHPSVASECSNINSDDGSVPNRKLSVLQVDTVEPTQAVYQDTNTSDDLAKSSDQNPQEVVKSLYSDQENEY